MNRENSMGGLWLRQVAFGETNMRLRQLEQTLIHIMRIFCCLPRQQTARTH